MVSAQSVLLFVLQLVSGAGAECIGDKCQAPVDQVGMAAAVHLLQTDFAFDQDMASSEDARPSLLVEQAEYQTRSSGLITADMDLKGGMLPKNSDASVTAGTDQKIGMQPEDSGATTGWATTYDPSTGKTYYDTNAEGQVMVFLIMYVLGGPLIMGMAAVVMYILQRFITQEAPSLQKPSDVCVRPPAWLPDGTGALPAHSDVCPCTTRLVPVDFKNSEASSTSRSVSASRNSCNSSRSRSQSSCSGRSASRSSCSSRSSRARSSSSTARSKGNVRQSNRASSRAAKGTFSARTSRASAPRAKDKGKRGSDRSHRSASRRKDTNALEQRSLYVKPPPFEPF